MQFISLYTPTLFPSHNKETLVYHIMQLLSKYKHTVHTLRDEKKACVQNMQINDMSDSIRMQGLTSELIKLKKKCFRSLLLNICVSSQS